MNKQKVIDAYMRHGSINGAAEELGIGWATVKRAIGDLQNQMMEVTGRADTYVELLEAHGINLDEWDVVSLQVGASDVTAKLGEGDDKYLETRQNKNFKVKVVPKPKVEQWAKLFESVPAKDVPRFDYWNLDDPHDAVLSIHDAHLGKLAWAMETTEDYDLALAEKIVIEAVKGVINKVQDFPVRQWYVPIGSDFFNVDNLENKTTKGTPQDQDGRIFKVFSTGQRVMEQIFEILVQVAPVKAFYLPGNHDYLTSWFLANTLKALYRNTPDIEIETSPRSRHFELLGTTLLVFDHGDRIKKAKWPQIILDECPKKWLAIAKRKEVQLGHEHNENVVSHGSTVVRTNPALSGLDAWHYREGYTGGERQALAYLYDKNGYSITAAHVVHAEEYSK